MHEIKVRNYTKSAASRERGRRFYEEALPRDLGAATTDTIVLSFEHVDPVTPSFLDETVVRLAEEHPELAGRLVITGLSEFARQALIKVAQLRRVADRLSLAT